jgi:RNA polymerase sigma factor (sigma-70 family)
VGTYAEIRQIAFFFIRYPKLKGSGRRQGLVWTGGLLYVGIAGRDARMQGDFVANPQPEDPEKVASQKPLDYLFDCAFRGDPVALRHFLILLQAERETIIQRMKGLGTGAHTGTVEEVYQSTVVDLMEGLREGKVSNLKDEDRKDILKYFQRRCDGRLRDYVRPRKSPALERHMQEVSDLIPDPNARIPGEGRHTEHLALMAEAARQLSPENFAIYQMHLDQVPIKEIALRTGKKEETLRNTLVRIREQLRDYIVPKSQTAEFNYRKQQILAKRRPSWEMILDAISILPPGIQEAIRHVHIENRSLEELAHKLGDRGLEKAESRIKQGYMTLSGRLKYPFPEAFTKVGPEAKKNQLTRKDIESAVDKLPPYESHAFRYVHIEGHTLEELAQNIGDDDETHRAQARLDEAYRILHQRLKEVFPDAYERASE